MDTKHFELNNIYKMAITQKLQYVHQKQFLKCVENSSMFRGKLKCRRIHTPERHSQTPKVPKEYYKTYSPQLIMHQPYLLIRAFSPL